MTYLDRRGNPLNLDAMSALLKDRDYRKVGHAEINDSSGKVRYLVSTVWLGIDHGFGSVPILFETMVFPAGDFSTELDCTRYSTEAEALRGHAETVARFEALVS